MTSGPHSEGELKPGGTRPTRDSGHTRSVTSGPHEHAERIAEIRRRAEAHVVYPLTRDEALWLCDALDEKILTHTADEWLSHRFSQEYERAKSALAELERIGDPTEMAGSGDPAGFPPSPAMREMWCRINRARAAIGQEPIRP